MNQQKKILIVDDEPINIDVLVGLLQSDYALTVAKNGERALKSALGGKPDLILLDIMMPDMDGYEVCARLKSDPITHEIPVIFITALNQVSDETKGLELGAADYIIKPISPPILKARVKTQLALSEQQRELQATYAIIKSQKDRMEEELNIGRSIQMSMMPLDFPTVEENKKFSLNARLVAAREVGGDFYDFFFLRDSKFCFCVGDVSGKGVPAALFMAVAKTLIKSYSADNCSTGTIISRVNNTLSRDNEYCMFATIFLAICDIRSGELTYTNAGHNPPYIANGPDRLVRLDERHGPVAGALEEIDYGENKVRLEVGDTFLVYTDGVTEAADPSGELFSEDRLVELIKQYNHESSEVLINSMLDSIGQFEAGGEQTDDITVLAFQYFQRDTSEPDSLRESKTWRNLQNTEEVNFWFGQFAETSGLEASVRRKVNTVLDDLLSNIMTYAYPNREVGEIAISLTLDEAELVLSVVDDGERFNPLAREDPDLTSCVQDREIGGLGIHLICTLMDPVVYQRLESKNVLTMTLKF